MDERTNSMISLQTSTGSESDSRLRILYLYQMLLTQTDEDHTLSTKQITDRMMEQHNILVHRTTVSENVSVPGNTTWQTANSLCRS